ncbi:MAG: type II toxin-antitoxin system VapC family toxin [Candidatus Bathyarchaeia archaeon]|nr:type II toxin-antitoxin system VapC family toxin [Candidatus Bathyarchaeota archaeon]
MRFVDSNVFIYVLVGSPKENYETAKKILKRIEEGEEAITNTAVIQEIADWLEYNNKRREVEKLLSAMNSYVTIDKKGISWKDVMEAVEDMNKYDLDLVDAITLQTMKKYGVKEIYTNDRDFDRVTWIRRIWM